MDIAALRAEHDQLSSEAVDLAAKRDDLLAQAEPIRERQRDVNARLAAVEQRIGDLQALDALRERGGVDGALAAAKIAATMPDPERAAAFDALATELTQ